MDDYYQDNDAYTSANHAEAHEVPFAVEASLTGIIGRFQKHDLASSEECEHIATTVSAAWTLGNGADPIDALAKLRASSQSAIDGIVEDLSMEVAQLMPVFPLRVPFAGRLMTPTSFYDKFPSIERLCRLMMVPVTFNEDADVIGLTSINPHFAETLSAMIIDELKSHTKVTPLISITRLDYTNWRLLNEKHFRKGGSYD